MDTNVTVDVGKNMKDLLEKLAHQLGTTVDKIYPYYVKKATVEAYTGLATLGLLWSGVIVFTIVALLMWKRYNHFKDDGHSYGAKDAVQNTAIFFTIVAGIVAIVAGIASLVTATDIAQGLFNPDYIAIHNLLNDVRK